MAVYEDINRLVGYGVKTGLVDEEDVVYTQNRLLEAMGLVGFPSDFDEKDIPIVQVGELEGILKRLLDDAQSRGMLLGEGVVYRDLFDTKLMGCMVTRPSQVIAKFFFLYERLGAQAATDWFYNFSCNTDYIRRYRIKRDVKWQASTPYGNLDITINLSKPEKDPKAIAAAKNAPQSGYPKCPLCPANVGYAGNVKSAPRQNHRIIPLVLNGEDWGFQYSPYVYYNEHCIVFNYKHTPMKIDHATFVRLLEFVTKFPHYTIGSNADLPVVGGSILSHDHFQGGAYEFPLARAAIREEFSLPGYPNIKAGIVNWPMSVIRLVCNSIEPLIEAADKILGKWRAYTDEQAFIFANTDNTPHNTITPFARKRSGLFELDLVLRNNITTKEHPLGVYHPHEELWHIKKENIGLIEVAGLAILPARLKDELAVLADTLIAGGDVRANEKIAHHADWADTFKEQCKGKSRPEVDDILRQKVGEVFSTVLEHAGVYKCDDAGKAAFKRFVATL